MASALAGCQVKEDGVQVPWVGLWLVALHESTQNVQRWGPSPGQSCGISTALGVGDHIMQATDAELIISLVLHNESIGQLVAIMWKLNYA